MTDDPNGRIEISLEGLDGSTPPASPAAGPAPDPSSAVVEPSSATPTALPPLPPRQAPKVVEVPENRPTPVRRTPAADPSPGTRGETAAVVALVGLGFIWKLITVGAVLGGIAWYFYAQQDTQELECISYQVVGETPPFPDIVTCFLNGRF